MQFNNITRIFDMLDGYRNQYQDRDRALSEKRTGQWKHYSAADYVSISDQLSMALLEIGVKKGDKIATVLFNSPEWNFLDMAIAQTGAVHVPIYPTISTESYKFIFKDAGIRFISSLLKTFMNAFNHFLMKSRSLSKPSRLTLNPICHRLMTSFKKVPPPTGSQSLQRSKRESKQMTSIPSSTPLAQQDSPKGLCYLTRTSPAML
jgi:long-subunit acyl-CoA synthetase (AMP-forming)